MIHRDRRNQYPVTIQDEQLRRRGIAEKLSYAALEKARDLGAEKVILYSNRILVPAITMYHKLGFTEVPIEKDIVYERSDIKMEINLSILEQGMVNRTKASLKE